jgi:hypothetical protein
MSWPIPPWPSRYFSAIRAAATAAMPAMLSARPNDGRVGGRSAGPVWNAKPLIASASVPKPGRCAYGPLCPKPVSLTSTSPGLSARSRSGPSPHRSSVPGRKFSTTTSAHAASRRNTSAPSAHPRSSPTVRLLRLISFHHSGTPSFWWPWPRMASPCTGCSILMTSAPKSPSIWQHRGPARIVDTSTTRSPSRGIIKLAFLAKRSGNRNAVPYTITVPRPAGYSPISRGKEGLRS